jgi:hypothetical protein
VARAGRMGCFMQRQSESSVPAASTSPRMFFKTCGYALVGLESRACPECGRGFDPGNRRTFATRPPRGWVWRWWKRVVMVVLLLLLAAGAGLGWLWWGWKAEQPTIARLRATGQQFSVAPIGPQRLRSVLGEHLGYLTDRVDYVFVVGLNAAKTEQLDLRSFTQIQQLSLLSCELSYRNLNGLAGLAKLRELVLFRLKIEKQDLTFLEKLPMLTTLLLQGKWIDDAGFEHIGRLGHLKVLTLDQTGMTDADLRQFRSLCSLEELNLVDNPISDAGLEHLQGLKSLKRLGIDERLVDSPGMAKLRQAIPGLEVSAYSPRY